LNIEHLYLVEWGIRIAMSPVIVLRRRSPSAALAWLVVVLVMPFIGTAAYFFVGENRLGRKRRWHHKRVVERLSRVLAKTLTSAHVVNSELALPHQLISSLGEGLGSSPPIGGNDLELLHDVEVLLGKLTADIDAATHHCHLLYYIFNDDSVGQRVGQALMRACQRGVKCRLLVDAVGSRPLLNPKLWSELRQAGVELTAALPVNPLRAIFARLDLRNHRKLAIIDGRVAYLGSHNVSEARYPKKERFGAWVDASVRVTGPAVQVLQELFVQDWSASAGELPHLEDLFPPAGEPSSSRVRLQILPTGPSSEDSPIEKVILQAIHVARERIVLTTPYFVPDDSLVDALRAAAVRGVNIVLIVPKLSDAPVVQAAGRSRYGDLLRAGVEIHEYTRGLLHAKTVTVDRSFALVGSANLDIRSFMLNFELSVLVYDDDFASQVHFLQASYIQDSERVSRSEWRRRGFWQVLIDNLSKLMSPLL